MYSCIQLLSHSSGFSYIWSNLELLAEEQRLHERAVEVATARAKRVEWIKKAVKCGDAIDRCM